MFKHYWNVNWQGIILYEFVICKTYDQILCTYNKLKNTMWEGEMCKKSLAMKWFFTLA